MSGKSYKTSIQPHKLLHAQRSRKSNALRKALPWQAVVPGEIGSEPFENEPTEGAQQNSKKNTVRFFEPRNTPIKIETNDIEMSVGRGYAQVAPKKNFVVDVDTSGWGANVYLQQDFDAWYAIHASAVTQVGSVYVVNSASNFIDTINGSDILGHVLGDSFLQSYNKRTLMDMGKEISIGIPSNPRMLVFRQVALPFEPALQGTGVVGYVVVENNASDLTRPRFRVSVARA